MALAAHHRLTFSGVFGTLAAPYERWALRLNMGDSNWASDPSPMLAAALTAWETSIKPGMRSYARLTEIKHAHIAAGGLYDGDPTILEVDVPGTDSGTVVHPIQCALAVSLVTERRGPTGRGRFFWPAIGSAVSATDGLLNAAASADYAAKAAAFINALNSEINYSNLVVASTKGYNTPVTGVRVGRVVDTVRSRRRSLQEDYSAVVPIT